MIKRLCLEIMELSVELYRLDTVLAELADVIGRLPAFDPNPPRERRKKIRKSS